MELSTDRINEIITSIIDTRFEDSIQDVWVRILEEKPNTEQEILDITREVNYQDARISAGIKYRQTNIETAIKDSSDEIGNLLVDKASPQTLYNATFSKIFAKNYNDHISNGCCLICGTISPLLNHLCLSCYDYYLSIYSLYPKYYFRIWWKLYHVKKIEASKCFKCNEIALPNKRYCYKHLLEHRERNRFPAIIRYRYRRDNHFCVNCGEKLDNNYQKVRCHKCSTHRNEKKRTKKI